MWRRVPATDSRLQWLLLLSSPAAVCSVQQHGPARSTQRQGGIYSPAALHRHPPHPTGNTRSYQATGKHTHISHTHWSKYMIRETFWYHQKRPTVKNMLLGLRKKNELFSFSHLIQMLLLWIFSDMMILVSCIGYSEVTVRTKKISPPGRTTQQLPSHTSTSAQPTDSGARPAAAPAVCLTTTHHT